MKLSPVASHFHPADSIGRQALRYLYVGGIAFAVDFLLLVSLTELCGINYLVSAVVAFSGGLLINYCLCTTYVFSTRVVSNRQIEFAVFGFIGVVGLVLTELILWLGEEVMHIDYRIAKFGAVAVVMAWNFGVRRAVLFRAGK